MATKKACQRRHAKQRAKERYGIELNKHQLNAIVNLIQNNKAIFVERQSLRITLWDVTYENQEYRVVYDRNRKTIVTFLFKEKPNPETVWPWFNSEK